MHRLLTALALCCALSARAVAQTGVSDDRVSVPDGPGSVEGLGDNASVDANMGLMAYAVPFELPQGFAGATPQLGLTYGSGNGNSIVGIGWSMRVPSIERLTLRGLPSYDADDEFVASGSEQLVRVSSSGASAVYRARHEGAFVRYTWSNVGASGYWKAEYPDGTVGYFGATANGTLVPEARLAGAEGQTFRYHLVETVDVRGHRVVYDYTLVDGSPTLASVGYAHAADGTPRYTASFTYVSRGDVISDCKPGFDERITRKLSGVSVAVSGEQIRRVALTYESSAASGGLSRLARVESFGRNGTRYPVVFAFDYSRSLSGVCAGPACGAPFVVHMGTLPTGSAIHSGNATLVDINGDALPDVLDTTVDGFHTFVLNRLDGAGGSSFDPVLRHSAIGTRNGFAVNQPTVQEVDLNGDGLTDLLNTFQQTVLCNDGSGDWKASGCGNDGNLGLVLGGSLGGDDPTSVRFLDVDGDRRIDALQTLSTTSVVVRLNTGASFEALDGAEPIGVVFDQSRLLLSDMNGDGLLDPVHFFATGAVRYRKHLGRARWGEWIDMPGPAIAESQRAAVELEDLNGDGLDDLVLVEPDAVSYALNRAGASFDATFTRITGAAVAGLPARAPDTTVVYADMNANGSLDVVWIQIDGTVDYLELFPVQPNLLSRIENGIGMVQEIHYGTAAGQRRDDAVAWTHTLPVPSNVVTRLDTWTTLTGGEAGAGLHEITDYRYRDGFYAGAEKEFRGFARVEITSPADAERDDQEPGRTVQTFDLGVADTYRKGRQLSSSVFSGSGPSEHALTEARSVYGDCAVAGVPASGLRFPVRYVCEQSRKTILKEGAPEAEWATTRTTTTYDGYGQVTLASNLGVVNMGSPESPGTCGACAASAGNFGGACGAACSGDEAFTETHYVEPGAATSGRWILGRAHTVRHYGVSGGPSDEIRTYYDGPSFVGLSLGQLTLGEATRTTARREAGSDTTVAVHRVAFDADGNVSVELDPLGSAADDTEHRRSYGYDATGLRVVRTDVHVTSPEGTPYRLRREYSYDAAFDKVSEASGWMVIEGVANRSARNPTSARYDEFGRRIAIIRPGDTEQAPTVEYVWTLASPASRVVERKRTVRGGAIDLERVMCLDGRGRAYQERTRLDGNRYQIDGFAEYNSRGAPVRVYQPYVGTGGFCDTVAPTHVRYEDVLYDAAEREVRRTLPDAATFGTASGTATVFRPLSIASFDESDLDPSSPHANTPTIVHVDGLGRTTSVERRLTSSGEGAFTRAEYDGLGNLVSVVDAAGHRKTQSRDLLGRVLAIDDPNSGATSFEYDDANNVLARIDARGVASRSAYDGANRVVATWDEASLETTEVRIRYDIGGSCVASACGNAEGKAIEVSYPLEPDLVARVGGDARGVDHFGFDARGQSTYVARTIAGLPLVTRRVFDDAGRLTATIHPDGRRIDRAFDGASRVVGIDGVLTDVEYDARGTHSRFVRANGAIDAWETDERMRLSRRTLSGAHGDAIEDTAYGRDRTGNILTLDEGAETAGTFRPMNAQFTYDAWHRVSNAEYLVEDEAPELQTRQYDATDNVLSMGSSNTANLAANLGELAYGDARPNAVISAAGIELRYDASGYLTGRGDMELAWDHRGRLAAATRQGQVLARLSYGSGTTPVAAIEGNSVTLYGADDFEVRDGIGVIYARVGMQRVARLESAVLAPELLGDLAPLDGGDQEVNAADAWIAHAAAADLVDAEPTEVDPSLLLRSAARRLLAEAGDAVANLHADHLGSIVAATDASGTVRGRRRYVMPLGANRQSGFVDRYGFSGQEELASLGLVRFEHRWLESTTQRWTNPDPAFERADELTSNRAGELANRYAYVGNNYVNDIDPTGLAYLRGAANAAARHAAGQAMGVAATAGFAPAAPAAGAAVVAPPAAAAQPVARTGTFREAVITQAIVGATAGGTAQAHHLIPWGTMRNAHGVLPIVARAANGGFHFDGAENGIHLGYDLHHGAHPEYNQMVEAGIAAIAANVHAHTTDAEIAAAFRAFAVQLRADIVATPHDPRMTFDDESHERDAGPNDDGGPNPGARDAAPNDRGVDADLERATPV